MRVRRSIIAVGAAVILGTTGALLVPAVASAHSDTHTLTFTSVENMTVNFTKTTGGEQNTDVNAAGTTVGFDMLYFTIISSTIANVNLTIDDTSGGFLYGTATGNLQTGAVTNGKVTGGTGAFKGACGTITITPISSTKEAVTITYST